MPAGRPPIYTGDVFVRINAKGKTKLQQKSERRAVINLLVENRGRMTIGAINTHFDYDLTSTLIALERLGWLEIEA